MCMDIERQKARVVTMGEYTGDARYVGIKEFLEVSQRRTKESDFKATKAITIFLDDHVDKDEVPRYDITFNQSGLSISEMISLLEVVKVSLTDRLLGGY